MKGLWSLGFVKLNPDAIIPSYAHEGDSGFDLRSIENVILAPKAKTIIKTGLAANIPSGTEIQIRPRSGMSIKTDLDLPNSPGTVDSCYTGEWGVIVRNYGEEAIKIKKGDRIAQAVLTPVLKAHIFEAKELDETSRGAGAYGSTGTK